MPRTDLRTTVARLMRFGIVGVANTAVYYLLYRLLLVGLPYLGAHLLAWAGSVVFSFFMNCWFTYRVPPTWRRFVAFPASTLVNLAFTSLGSFALVEWLGADKRYVTLAMGILAIPFTFAVTTWVLTGRGEPAGTAARGADVADEPLAAQASSRKPAAEAAPE